MKHFIAIFISLLSFTTHAQTVQKLNAEIKYGFIIPHAEDLRPVSSTNPIGLQLTYSQMGLSQEAYEVCNCFFDWGVQLNFHDFNNRDILGQAISVSTFFEPILARWDKMNFSIRGGIGTSYLTRVYDEQDNPENQFFSAPLSFLIYLQPRLNFQISESWDGNLSLFYNHISNGGQSQPNRGMNYPMLGGGATYYFDRQPFPDYSPKRVKGGVRYYAEVFSTQRKSEMREGRDWVLGFGAGAYHPVSGINALGLGGELAHDQSLNQAEEVGEGFIAAPFISHHFLFGRFEFAQRFAYYASKPDNYTSNNFYQRYILQYRVWEGLHLGASLKSHAHVAENIDVRVQWKF
ncbi:acyloxyacyl hydrolase [Litoribacter ruber]|uniref:Acyloxyacyl hydrolase n=1 Tax=Litoribacter ruber TaxID=702568 RepID=A0AAP2G1U2_9BACT|nr:MULTISPECIES: acyloxyacyl hydrolase [Litoribacter]MBS9525169.1 acyloxyacyl hydrolase [Litoribacter alkaliphilus]MBT0811655.1 acyloxyacyl hydrolase [Litoribacter ruber]